MKTARLNPRYGGYAGLPRDSDLSDAALDSKCSIRFQTTFLPVEDRDGISGRFHQLFVRYTLEAGDGILAASTCTACIVSSRRMAPAHCVLTGTRPAHHSRGCDFSSFKGHVFAKRRGQQLAGLKK